MRMTLDYPPVWLAGFAAAAWLAGEALPLRLPLARAAGWALIAAGVLLIAAAAAQMLARRTTLDPHGVPSTLVTQGVFRFSRNPIYLADVLILTGLCLAWDAAAALPLVPAFATIITRRFIRPEEARLAAAFPQAFAHWSARTRRWL